MASISYDGSSVQSGVSKLQGISSDLSTYSSEIYEATKIIVNANGFEQHIGGIGATTFSDVIDNFQSNVQALIDKVRQGQMQILTFSKDKNDISFFLNSLSEEEKSRYNLEDIQKLQDCSSNIFARIGATLGTGVAGLLEGSLDFFETGADLLIMAGSGLATIFTAGIDFFMGKHGDDSLTSRLWKWTQGFVADKKVENIFNRFYSNTTLGKQLKANAYGFETVRSVGKGVGYTAGVVGLTILTGGLASGGLAGTALATSTAAGSVSASQLALIAGTLGFSNGTEEAWAEGADLLDGVKYGLASGAWEGTQWFIGGKIGQLGGSSTKAALTRVGLDTVDAAADGFVKPALNLMYKNDSTKNLAQNYQQQFEEAGGWKNVAKQAAFGAALSGIGETTDARKLLKESQSKGTPALAIDNGVREVVGTTTAAIDGKVVQGEILSAPRTSTASNGAQLPTVSSPSRLKKAAQGAKEAVVSQEFRHNAAETMLDNVDSYISGGTGNIDTNVVKQEIMSSKLANVVKGDHNRVNIQQALGNVSLDTSSTMKAKTNSQGLNSADGSNRKAMTTISAAQ